MSFKIAFVGAGSIGFTRKLLGDLLTVPEFDSLEVALCDISEPNLDMIRQLAERDIRANGLDRVKLSATTDRREAIAGARYVFCTVRVGGIEAFATDIDVPLRYGIDQCVGDTLSAGGVMYGQRGIPVILGICRDIREVAEPGCRLFNYANPMAMLTWAANDHGGVETIGLCHGVQGGHRQIAEVLGIPQQELDIIAAGINHQTWYVQLRHRGKDMTGELLAAYERHPKYRETEKVRIDMLRRFGYYSTESNGHLSEYVPWFRKRPEEIRDWIDMRSWILGETGGYLRLSTERRDWFEEDFPHWMAEPPEQYTPETRSTEHGSYILEGLETGRVYRGHFNVENQGCITNLAADACVEVPGYVDRTGLHIPRVGDLPLGCAAVCNASISVQRLAVEAAMRGDDRLLVQAMMMDPLVGAVCTPPEIAQMVDDLLIAQAEWLPQYGTAIAAARERVRSGPRLPTRDWEGAARLPVRSVEELRQEDEAGAIAAKTIKAEEEALAAGE
jgi:alpha-galactosidase